jgi:hypothetical protein
LKGCGRRIRDVSSSQRSLKVIRARDVMSSVGGRDEVIDKACADWIIVRGFAKNDVIEIHIKRSHFGITQTNSGTGTRSGSDAMLSASGAINLCIN